MQSSSVSLTTTLLVLLGFVAVGTAAAQPVGTFTWQLQPYCNRVTFAVTQSGGVYTLDGFDDRCGVGNPAAATGVAALNPNGSVSLGLTIVDRDTSHWPGVPATVHVDATIDLSSLNGAWIDSTLRTGTLAFNASTGGDPRPSPLLAPGLAAGYIGTAPSGGGAFFGRGHRGPATAPESVESGDQLARFGGGGFHGQQFNWPTGLIRMVASEDWSPTANGTRIQFSTTPNGSTAAATRVTVDQDGFVGIGTTTPADPLDVNGDIRVGTSGTNGCVRNNNGGTLVGVCASDARFKRDVVAYSDVLERVTALRPVQFSWRADAFPGRGFGAAREAGLVAQEVEQVWPELVQTDEEGYKAVDYSTLPLLAIQAVRELNAKNGALERQNAALEQRLAALEERLRRLTRATRPR